MAQKEKELLLKDLCARLPYGVKILYEGQVKEIQYIEPLYNELKLLENDSNYTIGIEEIKPYLRPMPSMTEEERKEYNDIVKNTINFYDCQKSEEICLFIIPIDWVNAHHFDYRGLIPMGLALEAPEGMY